MYKIIVTAPFSQLSVLLKMLTLGLKGMFRPKVLLWLLVQGCFSVAETVTCDLIPGQVQVYRTCDCLLHFFSDLQSWTKFLTLYLTH